jgi:hypothetical protein
MVTELKKFIPVEINGWKKYGDDRIFNSKTIFDYINGSGEVYCSYNFRILLVREFRKSGQPPIIVDFFDMGSSEDAFGVFSHDYENQELGIGQGSFYLAGSLTFWKGPYFVSIWAEKENEEIKKTIFKLAESISNAIPEKGSLPELIGYLPDEKLDRKNIKFFHNHYSLNYHYYLSEENILNLNQKTKAVFGEYRFEDARAFILIVKYLIEKEAENAIISFIKNYVPEAGKNRILQIENGKWISFGKCKEIVYILLDFPEKSLAEKYSDIIKNSLKEIKHE